MKMPVEPTNNIYGIPAIRKQDNTARSPQKRKKPKKNDQDPEEPGTVKKPIIDIRV